MTSLGHNDLTHWSRDEIDAILQMTFSNAFSWMKMFEFQSKFHWNLFPKVQLTITHHWFRKWLGTDQVTSHYLNQRWVRSLTHKCITWPRWVKESWLSLTRVMAWCLTVTKPLLAVEQVPIYHYTESNVMGIYIHVHVNEISAEMYRTLFTKFCF